MKLLIHYTFILYPPRYTLPPLHCPQILNSATTTCSFTCTENSIIFIYHCLTTFPLAAPSLDSTSSSMLQIGTRCGAWPTVASTHQCSRASFVRHEQVPTPRCEFPQVALPADASSIKCFTCKINSPSLAPFRQSNRTSRSSIEETKGHLPI